MQYQDLSVPSLKKVIALIGIKIKHYSNSNPFRVIIFGFFGMNNIGDDAILFAEIKQLKNLGIPLKIVVPSRYPDNIRKQFSVDSCRFSSIFYLLISILQSNLIIIGGGGLFCKPSKKLTIGVKISDFLFTLYKNVFFIILPKLLGKKVIIFGVGFYDNQSKISMLVNLIAFKFVDYISVRDRHSYDFLKNIISNKTIHFEKDIVFSLTDIKSNLILENTNENNINVGISLVPIGNQFHLNAIISNIVNVMNKYHSKCNFYYFPFNTNPGEQNDITIIESINKKLNSDVMLSVINKDIGPLEYIHLYKQLDFSINMRFHAQVFAYLQKKLFIGISYDKKCKSFLEDIKAQYTETENFDLKLIESSLNKALNIRN